MKPDEVVKKLSKEDNIPFIYESSGKVYCEVDAEKIDQIGTMLIQTLESLGIDGLDLLEVAGTKRSVAMRVAEGRIVGSIYQKGTIEEIQARLDEIEKTLAAEGEAEVAEATLDLKALSEKINMILTEFLGDFAPRVYRNQLKVLGIEEGELALSKVKELIYALGNAASLMIGPTQSQEMTERLFMLIK
ncbi:hypothetical protein DRP53_05085 [candidate division WOR-3 bacterium]|uniref:Uncharacterized protein n=1 Tax=candidate division WOR-3 bacterium TaxID=2052148 RepID=A0A660SK49_UNCW3|nr:MAG: hypothetical protein DRP53_05085 [candidate division WOR-3 bacterium]